MREETDFVEFAQGVRDRLRRTAYLLCGDWEQAADHTQEALIRVYVAWPRIQRAGHEYGYARKAVVSAFLDHARRRSSRELPAAIDQERAGGTDVAEGVTARAVLMSALATLPPRQRACVVLRYFDDLSVGATATLLGCTEGTVKSQTAKALTSLRQHFQGSSFGELITEGANTW